MLRETYPKSFRLLACLFGLFVLFLYGPTLTITVLSFQGPDGGLTFPMNGVSLTWFFRLFQTQAVGDFGWDVLRAALPSAVVVRSGRAWLNCWAARAVVPRAWPQRPGTPRFGRAGGSLRCFGSVAYSVEPSGRKKVAHFSKMIGKIN